MLERYQMQMISGTTNVMVPSHIHATTRNECMVTPPCDLTLFLKLVMMDWTFGIWLNSTVIGNDDWYVLETQR